MTNLNISKKELVEKAQELHDDIVIFLKENPVLRLNQEYTLKDIKVYLEQMNYIFTEEELNNE